MNPRRLDQPPCARVRPLLVSARLRPRNRPRTSRLLRAGTMSIPSRDGQPLSPGLSFLSVHGAPLEIPDHDLIRQIGAGSYGEVWLVRNVLGSYRAAKFVERSAFPEARPFEREFGGVKKFEPVSRTHPNFVNILHVGRNESRGYFYCVMELADDLASGPEIIPDKYAPRTLGGDLARRGRLPLSECLQIGLSLATALKHLHQHGLIHRDIKPSNIIFVNGVAKLADIGLVAAIDEAGTSLGTLGYVPRDEPAGPAADLYSLGMVIYEAGTGNPPSQFPELPGELAGIWDPIQFARFNEIILLDCESDPRKRFHSAEAMRAALGRCLGAGADSMSPPTDGSPPTRVAARPAQGERKLLTMLALNIAATGRPDPEALQSFMGACLDRVRPVLHRYEGAVTQMLSDGALAGFGGAVAVEDHARRATLASLEIMQKLKAARRELAAGYGFDFAVRIGLNTGLDIATRGEHGLPPAGDTVNLASRVVTLAEADQVIITQETWKIIADHFDTRPLDEQPSPGPAAGLKVYEVLGAKAPRTRIEVEAERGLTPYVGRHTEISLLRERLVQARSGRGQIVLLAGEPGMGKSRLLFEFQRSLAGTETGWLAGRSISFGAQMAYLPIIDLLRRLLGIKEGDDPATIAGCLEAEARTLGQGFEPALPFLKYLFSLHSGDDPVVGMDAQERRVKTFESLRKIILTKAGANALVVVVEDLHWADKTSEDFLVSLADSMGMAPLLLLLTYRPGYRNPFPERSFITRSMLQPLSDEESLALTARVRGEEPLPEEFQKLVVAKAEGNPFFVEEMIKSLDESGALRARKGASASSDPPLRIQVPDTIQDVIMSRIDRLEESPRTTLQLASVIGREFSVNLLETIADLNEPLADSLQKLKSLELIYERSFFPEHTCFFKHALTQEVAYNSLLLLRRKELHCLVAASLEEMHSGGLPEMYELLAYHYERGEEWERALDYLRRAAEQCRRVGAYREEALQLSRAMAMAQRLGRAELLTDLRGRRGAARVKIGMFAEAKPDLELALAELPSENCARRAELLLSLAGAYFWGLDTAGTARCSEEGHALAEKSGRADLVAEALTYLGATQQSLGNLASATTLFEDARARGGGCSSAALANYPLTLYLSGRPREALERARHAAETFQGSSDPFAASFGHPHLGLALAACGKYAEAAAVFEEAKQLSRKHEIWHFHARAIGMSVGFHLDVFDLHGYELLALETRERARSAPFRPSEVSATIDLVFNSIRRDQISQAENLAKEADGLVALVAGWHEWLWRLRMKQARAELACARQDWPSALLLASDAVSESRARGRPKYVAAGLETRAKVLAALGRTPEAIAELRAAVGLARGMGDPALFIRTATALLPLDGSDALLSETRGIARKILAALPSDEMRRNFQAAQPVRSLGPI